MSAYFFYAGVFGLLSGIFWQSVFPVPMAYVIGPGCIAGIATACIPFIRNKKVRRLLIGIVLFFLALGCGIVRTMHARTELPQEFESLLNTNISIEGIIVAPPDVRETNDHLTVEIQKGGAKMRILANTVLYPVFHVGDRVHVSGIAKAPAPFDSDGGRVFRYDKFLAKDGVFAVVQPARVEVIGSSGSWWLAFLRSLEWVKDTFDDAIDDSIPQPESALAIGIVAGGKQGLGKRLLDAFTVAGMLQIVVLSGYNVMIVAEGVLATLRTVPKRTALIIAAIVITLFVLAAGAGTSAVRAGIMALIALTARGTHRTYDVLRSLFIALALMLLWNPLLLVFDPGLQLSFMATLGLILGSNLIEMRLLWIGSATLREMVATTLAAQIAVLPILLWQSGNLSLVAIPANLLAMPVLPAAMALSAIAALCALIFMPILPTLATIAGIPAYVLLTYVIKIAEYSAQVPFANMILPAFPAWWLIPIYGALGWWVWQLRSRSRHQGSGSQRRSN